MAAVARAHTALSRFGMREVWVQRFLDGIRRGLPENTDPIWSFGWRRLIRRRKRSDRNRRCSNGPDCSTRRAVSDLRWPWRSPAAARTHGFGADFCSSLGAGVAKGGDFYKRAGVKIGSQAKSVGERQAQRGPLACPTGRDAKTEGGRWRGHARVHGHGGGRERLRASDAQRAEAIVAFDLWRRSLADSRPPIVLAFLKAFSLEFWALHRIAFFLSFGFGVRWMKPGGEYSCACSNGERCKATVTRDWCVHGKDTSKKQKWISLPPVWWMHVCVFLCLCQCLSFV